MQFLSCSSRCSRRRCTWRGADTGGGPDGGQVLRDPVGRVRVEQGGEAGGDCDGGDSGRDSRRDVYQVRAAGGVHGQAAQAAGAEQAKEGAEGDEEEELGVPADQGARAAAALQGVPAQAA